MIGKSNSGKDFGGLIRYVMDQEEAEVLLAKGVRDSSSSQCTKDFNTIRKAAPQLGNAVWHTSISFSPKDKVNNDLMINVASDVILGLGLAKSQFIVIRHHKTDHEHLHIIASRVLSNRTVISDTFSSNRTAQICDKLELKYGLTVAREQGKLQGSERVSVLAGVKKDLRKILSLGFDSGIEDWISLEEYLKQNDVQFKIDERGWKLALRGRWVKASAVDRAFSKGRIDKRFKNNQLNHEQDRCIT